MQDPIGRQVLECLVPGPCEVLPPLHTHDLDAPCVVQRFVEIDVSATCVSDDEVRDRRLEILDQCSQPVDMLVQDYHRQTDGRHSAVPLEGDVTDRSLCHASDVTHREDALFDARQ